MKSNLLKTGSMVFVLIILGKIFSLVREMYFSALFGTSMYADAYFTANIIPNLLNTPLTISSLVFFIPLYTQCRTEKGQDETDKFTSNLMTIYVIFNTCLAVFAILCSPVMIKLLVPEYSEQAYICTVRLSQLLVLSFPATIAVHVLMNVSNAHQKHFAPQLLTVCNSLIAIILMYFFVPEYGIYAVPVIGLAGWVVQLFFQGYCVRKQFRYKFYINLKDPLLRSMIVLALPVIVATAAEQINLSVDNVLASSIGTGSVSVLNYAQKLFNLLNGTIATAIITVSYPVFSRLYAEKNKKLLIENINKYFNIIMVIMIPIMALCMIFREEIVRVVFGRGAFEEGSVYLVGSVFMIYVAAIPFAALKELVTRIFYIYGESKLPMIINALCIAINISLSIVFVRYFGLEGIVGGTVIATAFACIIEIIAFRVKFPEERQGKIFSCRQLWKYIVASVIMSLMVIILNTAMVELFYIIRCICAGLVGLVVYIVLLVAMREKISSELLERVKNKVKTDAK